MNKHSQELSVSRTSASGAFGNAFVHVELDADRSTWRRISCSLPGPGFWQRFLGRWRRSELVYEIVRVTTSKGSQEYMAVWVEHDPIREITAITFPQSVSLADVPPGSAVEFVRREWAPLGHGILPIPARSPELRDLGGCDDLRVLEYEGNEIHDIRIVV